MLKTSTSIERDIIELLRGSELLEELRGTLYRAGLRPADATSEDAVLHFLTGRDEQIQEGFVMLTLYVPHLPLSRPLPDYERIDLLQRLVLRWLPTTATSSYLITTDGTPAAIPAPGAPYHLITARLRYRRLST